MMKWRWENCVVRMVIVKIEWKPYSIETGIVEICTSKAGLVFNFQHSYWIPRGIFQLHSIALSRLLLRASILPNFVFIVFHAGIWIRYIRTEAKFLQTDWSIFLGTKSDKLFFPRCFDKNLKLIGETNRIADAKY